MTQDEWGPWIEHVGRGCPVPVGEYVCIECCVGYKFPSGTRRYEFRVNEKALSWRHWGKILRYRIRKPRGLTILQRIAEQPERERIEA
ncbi:hypothetical protein KPG71_18830 [Roseovarius sp. PS-C2]|nr:hypothetical protein [Roseovarius sp. PS-C2]